MALQSCGEIFYPRFLAGGINTTVTGARMTADTYKTGHIFTCPYSNNGLTLDSIYFRTGNVATGADLSVRVETVNTSGQPSGTLAWTNASGTVGSSVAASTAYGVSLTSSGTLSPGTDYAIVFARNGSGTIDVYICGGNQAWAGIAKPYIYQYNGSSWTNATSGGLCVFGKAGSTYMNLGGYPASIVSGGTYGTLTYASNTTGPAPSGDEVALYLSSFPIKCRVVGIWAAVSPNGGSAFNAILYQNGSSAGSVSVDGDAHRADNGVPARYYFSSPVTLSAGDSVRVALQPSTTNSIVLNYFSVTDQTELDAYGLQDRGFWSVRTDAGSWDDTTTSRRPLIGLLVDQLDDGTGGGGTTYVFSGEF